jgi:hypothetical protein
MDSEEAIAKYLKEAMDDIETLKELWRKTEDILELLVNLYKALNKETGLKGKLISRLCKYNDVYHMEKALDTFASMVIPIYSIDANLAFIREELKKDEKYKKAIKKIFNKNKIDKDED